MSEQQPQLPQNNEIDILSNFTPLEIATKMEEIKQLESTGVDIKSLLQAENNLVPKDPSSDEGYTYLKSLDEYLNADINKKIQMRDHAATVYNDYVQSKNMEYRRLKEESLKQLKNPITSDSIGTIFGTVAAGILVPVTVGLINPNLVAPTVMLETGLAAAGVNAIRKNDNKVNDQIMINQKLVDRNTYLRQLLQNQIRHAPQIAPAQQQTVQFPIEIKDKQIEE